jgi:hypothetical protein
MKKILIFTFLILLAVVAACSIPQRPVVDEVPAEVSVVDSSDIVVVSDSVTEAGDQVSAVDTVDEELNTEEADEALDGLDDVLGDW